MKSGVATNSRVGEGDGLGVGGLVADAAEQQEQQDARGDDHEQAEAGRQPGPRARAGPLGIVRRQRAAVATRTVWVGGGGAPGVRGGTVTLATRRHAGSRRVRGGSRRIGDEAGQGG